MKHEEVPELEWVTEKEKVPEHEDLNGFQNSEEASEPACVPEPVSCYWRIIQALLQSFSETENGMDQLFW